jgi:hypothetical protein
LLGEGKPMRTGEQNIILNDQQAYYVETGKGNLPYLIFYQSKGGWPVFEMMDTWQKAFNLRQQFALHGVDVQIFHWINFVDPNDPRERKITIPAPLKGQ